MRPEQLPSGSRIRSFSRIRAPGIATLERMLANIELGVKSDEGAFSFRFLFLFMTSVQRKGLWMVIRLPLSLPNLSLQTKASIVSFCQLLLLLGSHFGLLRGGFQLSWCCLGTLHSLRSSEIDKNHLPSTLRSCNAFSPTFENMDLWQIVRIPTN